MPTMAPLMVVLPAALRSRLVVPLTSTAAPWTATLALPFYVSVAVSTAISLLALTLKFPPDSSVTVVLPADKAAGYQDVESLSGLNFAVENGSAGMEQADAYSLTYTPAQDQATALLEVSSGTADAAIIDYLMAVASTGEGTSNPDLTYTVSLADEQYGVGFRKGSDLAAKLNEFFAEKYADGTMQQLAEKYGIADKLVEQ